MRGIMRGVGVVGVVIAAGACGGGTERAALPAPEETAGDREFAALTAGWTGEARAAECGATLRDALATRDLVQAAVEGMAAREIALGASTADAKQRIADGDAELQGVRERLRAADCDSAVLAAVERAWQLYVQAGAAGVAFARPAH